MALIEFKNLPDTSTPINATNLNNNFNELNTEILDLTNVKTVTYSESITNITPGQARYVSIPTSVPTGYTLLGYFINGNGYISQVACNIISQTATYCAVNAINYSNQTLGVTISITGLYAKRVNQ